MMSYAAVPAASFQGFVPWHALQVETDEVYVWRGVVSGIDILSISDAQAIALAMGKASKGLNIYLPLVPLLFSLRGIALQQITPNSYSLDAAFTAAGGEILPPGWETATEMGEELAKELRQRWPEVSVSGAKYMVIDDATPKHPALDFWISHPVIWDPALGGGIVVTEGGPTAAWSLFQGLYQGTVEQGRQLKKWPRKSLPPLDKKKNGLAEPGVSWLPALLVVGGIGYVGYSIYARQQGAKGAQL